MECIEIYLTPPPSLNKARMARKVNLGKGKQSARIQDTDVLRKWKVISQIQLQEQLVDLPGWPVEHAESQGTFKMEVFWYGEHWFKNGNPKRRDIDNRVKFLMDQTFKAIGVDDCHVFDLILRKLPPQETPHAFAIDGEVCYCRVTPLVAAPLF